MRLSKTGLLYSLIAAVIVFVLLVLFDVSARESVAWSIVVAVVAYVGTDARKVPDKN